MKKHKLRIIKKEGFYYPQFSPFIYKQYRAWQNFSISKCQGYIAFICFKFKRLEDAKILLNLFDQVFNTQEEVKTHKTLEIVYTKK